MSDRHVIIVGGGFSGLAAAYDIAKAGVKVTIYEADGALGGLGGTFEISPGHRVEKFYHHWFASDTDVLHFLAEVGGEQCISFAPTNTGLYYANSIFRLASPFDLLRFTPL